MKVSLQWLKRYLDIDLDVDRISELLTGCGLEVEGLEIYESIKGSLQGVVTGQVVTCSKHPNADKLSVTTVNIGDDTILKIVCGAPNVESGQKVLVATVGTMIFKGEESFQIRETTIRGEISQGMICAEDELGLGDSHAGIMVLPEEVPIGLKASDYFKVYRDHILEIGLTPNRSDAFSHTGIARDLVALLNTSHFNGGSKISLKWPDVSAFNEDDHSLQIPVTVEDTVSCPRYCGLTFSNLTIGPSPDWLQNLLKVAGMRPINNVVDITNFVLLETGQPLHAFDARKISGGRVIVKKLAEGTMFTTLDGIDRELSGEDLMICNAVEGMCMAGVYGGLHSGITDETTSIFLESAYFNPVTIRKTSKRHGLKTDSSQRYERGANPEMTVYAMKRAALLLKEIAGARISSAIQDIYPKPVEWKKIQIQYQNIDKIIGKKIDTDVIKEILLNLEIKIAEEQQNGLLLLIPPFKVDVEREADIAEEILRIYGYNNVELTDEIKYSMVFSSGVNKETVKDNLSNLLCSAGFNEIMCNSLTREDYIEILKEISPDTYVKILNPLSRDLQYMRRTMLFGGLESILYNHNRKAFDLKFFEFGSVYCYHPDHQTDNPHDKYSEEEHLCLWLTGNMNQEQWQEKSAPVNFFSLKSIISGLFMKAGIKKEQYYTKNCENDIFSNGLAYLIAEGKLLAELGEVKSKVLKRFDIKYPVYYAYIRWSLLIELLSNHQVLYTELPRFPWVRRDLALLIDEGITYAELEKTAFETEKLLLKKMSLFDIYQGENIGEGKKSYAISFILQDDDKTLTEKEIDTVMDRLINRFKASHGAVIR